MREPLSTTFAYALGFAVAIAWLVAMGAEIISSGKYHTPMPVHGLMGTIVGAVFGPPALKRRRESRENGQP